MLGWCALLREASPFIRPVASPVLGAVQALRMAYGRQGKDEPPLGPASTLEERNHNVPGKHSIKRKRAERTAYRRAVEVVDARTLQAHLLTLDAMAAGQHAGGRYIALCDREV